MNERPVVQYKDDGRTIVQLPPQAAVRVETIAMVTIPLREHVRLLRVAEAAQRMPEPVALQDEFGFYYCLGCDPTRRWRLDDGPEAIVFPHAPTCPWQLLQIALRALDGGGAE